MPRPWSCVVAPYRLPSRTVPQRREYDSTDDFDDSLPTECAAADFYKVFGAAFRRNARWSTNQPVPDVGDDETPLDKVGARMRVLLAPLCVCVCVCVPGWQARRSGAQQAALGACPQPRACTRTWLCCHRPECAAIIPSPLPVRRAAIVNPRAAATTCAAGGCLLQLLVCLQELARVPSPRGGGHRAGGRAVQAAAGGTIRGAGQGLRAALS